MRSICSSAVRAGWGAPVGWNAAQNCAADLALAQARDVGVALGMDARQVVGDDVAARLSVDPDRPGEIVVAVEQRRARQQRLGLRSARRRYPSAANLLVQCGPMQSPFAGRRQRAPRVRRLVIRPIRLIMPLRASGSAPPATGGQTEHFDHGRSAGGKVGARHRRLFRRTPGQSRQRQRHARRRRGDRRRQAVPSLRAGAPAADRQQALFRRPGRRLGLSAARRRRRSGGILFRPRARPADRRAARASRPRPTISPRWWRPAPPARSPRRRATKRCRPGRRWSAARRAGAASARRASCSNCRTASSNASTPPTAPTPKRCGSGFAPRNGWSATTPPASTRSNPPTASSRR